MSRISRPVGIVAATMAAASLLSGQAPGVPGGRSSGGAATAFQAVDHATPEQLKATKDFAAGRKGYVVWESRRPSGTPNYKYRIWKRNLDGSGLAMISGAADQAGYAHLGPKISPDGRRVVFAGKKWNSDPKDSAVGPLLWGGAYATAPYDAWIVDIDPATFAAGAPRELRELRGMLGSGGEDRIFEWKDEKTIYVNIPDSKGVFEFNVETGELGVKVLALDDPKYSEVLVTPGGGFAYTAGGQAAAYGPIDRTGGAGKVTSWTSLGGCQVGASGGDKYLIWRTEPANFGLIDLATGRKWQLIEVSKALPPGPNTKGRGRYFPAISRDGSVIAVGRSLWTYTHAEGDYEIYLVNLDDKGQSVGQPVNYSANERSLYNNEGAPSMDRWPDVWVSSAK